jgi:hypothetical protein
VIAHQNKVWTDAVIASALDTGSALEKLDMQQGPALVGCGPTHKHLRNIARHSSL